MGGAARSETNRCLWRDCKTTHLFTRVTRATKASVTAIRYEKVRREQFQIVVNVLNPLTCSSLYRREVAKAYDMNWLLGRLPFV